MKSVLPTFGSGTSPCHLVPTWSGHFIADPALLNLQVRTSGWGAWPAHRTLDPALCQERADSAPYLAQSQLRGGLDWGVAKAPTRMMRFVPFEYQALGISPANQPVSRQAALIFVVPLPRWLLRLFLERVPLRYSG